MAKLWDIAVVVGTYKQGGEDKFKWKTVGAIVEGKGDKQYIMLDRTFNPAGVPDLDNRGSDQIVMSLFAPKDRNQQQGPETTKKAGNYRRPSLDDDDDQPF